MTRRRWIADEVSGDRAILVGPHAEHLSIVLRARIGQEFDIATGTTVRRGTIREISHDRVEFELREEVPAATTSNLTIALGIFKFDRMEWAIEKCTELGVAQIIPLVSQRSESHLVAAASKRVERWRRIAQQASEQSRRVSPPEITSPIQLKEFIQINAPVRILLAEGEQQTTLNDVLRYRRSEEAVALACGPEGGWTSTELKLFAEARWVPVSLGKTILRSETAAIAATTIVLSQIP
ncbi:MAG: RsmE family RNA methyltransferase [Terriglobales bacterium]